MTPLPPTQIPTHHHTAQTTCAASPRFAVWNRLPFHTNFHFFEETWFSLCMWLTQVSIWLNCNLCCCRSLFFYVTHILHAFQLSAHIVCAHIKEPQKLTEEPHYSWPPRSWHLSSKDCMSAALIGCEKKRNTQMLSSSNRREMCLGSCSELFYPTGATFQEWWAVQCG